MKKIIGILFIEQNKATIFLPDEKASHRVLPADVFHLGEILEKERFEGLIKSMLEEAGIKNILIILGSALIFEKEVSLEASAEEKGEFFEMVPYERVISRVYRLKTSEILVATNSDFCEEIMRFLEGDFHVVGIVPENILRKILPGVVIGDEASFKKFALLRTYSFIHVEEQEEKFSFSLPDIKDRRFLFLTGLFFVLLVILGTMIFTQMIQKKPINKNKRTQVVITKVTPVATSSGQLESDNTPTPTAQQ